MKKIIAVLVIAMVLLVVVPASAGGRAPTGEQISVFPYAGPMDFSAGEPFHIIHGFTELPNPGTGGFNLTIDGAPVRGGFRLVTVTGHKPTEFTVLWLFNFPDGMTGQHIFAGSWRLRCAQAVEEGYILGPCARPNAMETVLSWARVVTFTE